MNSEGTIGIHFGLRETKIAMNDEERRRRPPRHSHVDDDFENQHVRDDDEDIDVETDDVCDDGGHDD